MDIEIVGEDLVIEITSQPQIIEIVSEPQPIELLQGGIYNFIQVGFNNYEQLTPSQFPTFQLSNVPIQPDKSLLFVNGVKAFFGVDYNINGSILNWLSSLIVEQSDQIDFYYN